jgi:16S rRNA processing protein RimM
VLVPFVSAIVPEVNIEERFISVTPPLGLFETLDDYNAQDVANAH